VIGGDSAAGFRRYVDFVTKLYRWRCAASSTATSTHRSTWSAPTWSGSPLRGFPSPGAGARVVPPGRAAAAGLRLPGDVRRDVAVRGPAIYAVISYMDSVAGVWFPRGGMNAVPQAMAAAATAHGVKIRYDTRVAGWSATVSGRRPCAPSRVSGSPPTRSSSHRPSGRPPRSARPGDAAAAALPVVLAAARRLATALRRRRAPTRSTSAGPGARPSRRSSVAACRATRRCS